MNQDYDLPVITNAFEFYCKRATKLGKRTAVQIARAADAYGITPKEIVRFDDILEEFNLDPEDVTDLRIHEANEIHQAHTQWINAWIRNHNKKHGHSEPSLDDPTSDLRRAKEREEQGKRPKILGYPVTAVIRYMGAKGYNIPEVQKLLKITGIKMADTTISIQHKAGKVGDEGRGPPAPLTKSEEEKLFEMIDED